MFGSGKGECAPLLPDKVVDPDALDGTATHPSLGWSPNVEHPLHSDQPGHDRRREALGCLLMALASVVFCFSTLLTRSAAAYHDVPIRLLVFLRGPFMSVITYVYLTATGTHNDVVKPSDLLFVRCVPMLLLRATLGAMSLVLGFFSIALVPLGGIVSAYFLNPVFITLFSRLLLKDNEALRKRDTSALLLSLCGVAVMMAGPSLDVQMAQVRTQAFGVLLGVLSSMLISLKIVIARATGGKTHFTANSGALTVTVTIFGALMGGANFVEIAANTHAAFLALCACISGFCGQCIVRRASRYCHLGSGSPMRIVRIPIAYLMGYLILAEYPNVVSATGSACIAASVALLGKPW